MLNDYIRSPESFILAETSKPNLHLYDIYKYISIDRLLAILDTGMISLSVVSSWEDVYENWFLKTKIRVGTKEYSFERFERNFYGTCWTFAKSSDAMWRIYSPEKTGVRIQTTIDKFLRAAIEYFEKNPYVGRIYSGIVQYQTEHQIQKMVSTFKPESAVGLVRDYAMNSLFYKRRDFLHEREFRVVAMMTETTGEKYIPISINPNDLIETVMFDPRISEHHFNTFKSVARKLGYRNSITKSSLYKFKNYIIR